MSELWQNCAGLHLSPSSVKLNYDKAFRDKAFQADVLHMKKSKPSLPEKQQMDTRLKSSFEWDT